MDIFNTAVSSTSIIYQFLKGCADFSGDSKSLAARFQWDLAALEAIRDYFKQLQAQNGYANLSPEHEQLLKMTAGYLEDFATEVQKNQKRIERTGLFRTTLNRVQWTLQRRDVEKVQEELQYWTDKLGIRVLTLPNEIRNVIDVSVDSSNAPTMVVSNQKLLDFTRLAADSHAKKQLAREIFKDDARISQQIDNWGEISFIPLPDGDNQLIFATRRIPLSVTPESDKFAEIKLDVCELAAALNYLSPAANVRILRIEYCIYHVASNQFLLAQVAPYAITSMMTLGQMISHSPFPKVRAALNERVRLAHKLAEAVVFLHAAGYLHKNITSSSAVALRKRQPPGIRKVSTSSAPIPRPPLDEVYLMGFDLVRGVDSRTSKEGAEMVHHANGQDPHQSIWDRDIYMHPERLRGPASPRYQKAHDIYSLGVVLLEIGLWQPLSEAAGTDAEVPKLSKSDHPDTWPMKLRDLAVASNGLSSKVGKRYQCVVEWCLNVNEDSGVKTIEFVQQVLDPLENIANILS